MHRRDFLTGLALAGLSAPLRSTPAADHAPLVVDTHLHCFAGAGEPKFPYHKDAPYRPEKATPPEHLLKCMADGGVDFSIVVHPEPYQDDHRYLEHCLTVGQGRLKGTCLFFADRPDAIANMQALVKKRPGEIVAARIHAYSPERLPPFGKPELKAFWKAAGAAGLALQLHFEPRFAPGFEPLIKEFADVTVLVDHLGRPFQGTGEEYDRVVAWSKLPNVVMKLSSIPEPAQDPSRPVAAVIRRLTDAFGPDRLMCGGGYGDDATGDSYRQYHARVRSFLTHLSAADQAKILGGTAARLFQFQRKA